MVWIHGGGHSIGTSAFYDGGRAHGDAANHHLRLLRELVVGVQAPVAVSIDPPGSATRAGLS